MAAIPDGTTVGGFTQRAMIEIAREECGELPPMLAAMETRCR